MTKCNTFQGLFQVPKSRKFAVGFGGGHVSSDGGVILLRGIEERLGVIRDAAKVVGKYDMTGRWKTGKERVDEADGFFLKKRTKRLWMIQG